LPDTRYAKSGDVNIAYQVVGDGALDLILISGWVSNLEYSWEDPGLAGFYRRLAAFSRLILFDKRGTGLSDRVPSSGLPTMEQRMDDVRAVLDAAGSERAAVFGVSEGAGLGILFAATYPQRTSALAVFGAFAKRLWSADYPWAPTHERREAWIASLEEGWGGPVDLDTIAPSRAGDPRFAQWFATYLRTSASPSAAVTLARMNTHVDVRGALAAVDVPTLVVHHTDDRDASVEEGRYIAHHIPGAKFVELPGEDHIWFGADADAIADEVEGFLTGTRPVTVHERVLATVLFTDIVESTQRATAVGDRRWRELLDGHNALVRREIERFRGREVKATGDGFLATFDGPERAIRCAMTLVHGVRHLGVEMRAGLHTGECEMIGGDVGGIAVHIAARVLAEARPNEVLVSSTVRDLVAGSGLRFSSRGRHELKGVPGEWELLATER
jgi:class 3 adenylate cyclase/predicted alpha/beta hydrolase